MITCRDCIHATVCPLADGAEYRDIDNIQADCEYFALAADVVKVVRCKDCIYSRKCNCLEECVFMRCRITGRHTALEDYCSRGVDKIEVSEDDD